MGLRNREQLRGYLKIVFSHLEEGRRSIHRPRPSQVPLCNPVDIGYLDFYQIPFKINFFNVSADKLWQHQKTETRPISYLGWMKEEGNGFIESTTIARDSRGAKMGMLLNDNKREHLHVARSSAKKNARRSQISRVWVQSKTIRHQVNPN